MDGANPSCLVTACSDGDQCADRWQPRCRGPWTRRPEALRPRLSRGCALVWRVAVYMNAVDVSGRPAAKRSIEASIKHWRGLGRSGPQACPQLLGQVADAHHHAPAAIYATAPWAPPCSALPDRQG